MLGFLDNATPLSKNNRRAMTENLSFTQFLK
jgi:hypothetical protein